MVVHDIKVIEMILDMIRITERRIVRIICGIGIVMLLTGAIGIVYAMYHAVQQSKICKQQTDRILALPATDMRLMDGKYEITAYCSCKKCCGKNDGITYTGYNLHKNPNDIQQCVAATSSDTLLGFGRLIYIEDVGIYFTADKHGGDFNHIDIYIPDHEAAIKFGRQKRNVYTILNGVTVQK